MQKNADLYVANAGQQAHDLVVGKQATETPAALLAATGFRMLARRDDHS
jgi:hypothetical protein